jgi:nucleoside-diphosphate-sugar epimerase
LGKTQILTHNHKMNKLLIIGCGDIALRTARLLHGHFRLYGLVRNPQHFSRLRAAGIIPVAGNLDQPESLQRLAGLADTVIHLAPPPSFERSLPVHAASSKCKSSLTDTRTRNLLAALSHGNRPSRMLYISTSGVYGDCQGEVVQETRPLKPHNARAILRADAEQQIRQWSRRNQVRASILRVPGIYAADRLPVERLKKGTPAVIASEDGYTNHIHADDLARIIVAALKHGKANRVYHTVDDSDLKMGDYFDAVADAFSLLRPPRISRTEAQHALSPALLSFMNESRRLSNVRMKTELRVKLRYPTVADTLREIQSKKKIPDAPTRDTANAAQLEMFPAAVPPGQAHPC